MREINIDIDPEGDVASMKGSNRSWMSAMNDVKKGVNALQLLWKKKTVYSQKK